MWHGELTELEMFARVFGDSHDMYTLRAQHCSSSSMIEVEKMSSLVSHVVSCPSVPGLALKLCQLLVRSRA
jgi:hypothetical protein